jgi:hypothetical protein
MKLVITALPGRTKSDLNFQYYDNGVSVSISDIVVVERTNDSFTSSYYVSGLLEPEPGHVYTLTYSDSFQRYYKVYPSVTQPSNFVFPLGSDNLSLSDIYATLLLDGAVQSLGDLTLTSIGSEQEYVLSGLPIPPSGSTYAFGYTVGGVTNSVSWPTDIAGVNTAIVAQPSRSLITYVESYMTDTLTATKVTSNRYGRKVASEASLNIKCRVSGEEKEIRTSNGSQITSTVKVTTAGYYGLDPRQYVFGLPSRYYPNTNLEAISIKTVMNQTDPHHQVIRFL